MYRRLFCKVWVVEAAGGIAYNGERTKRSVTHDCGAREAVPVICGEEGMK